MPLLPLRDPGLGKESLSVAPMETKGGLAFYQSAVTARVMLDADPAKRHSVSLCRYLASTAVNVAEWTMASHFLCVSSEGWSTWREYEMRCTSVPPIIK